MVQVKSQKTTSKSAPVKMQNYNGVLLFDRTKYMLLGVCVALVAIGFLLMSGGASPNPNEFHPELLYSFRRVTLAPFIILVGFAVGIFAIVKKSTNE